MARDAMVFPQAIGLASTWQPELAEAIAEPVRDADAGDRAPTRASRRCSTCAATRAGAGTEETFGEDPYLVARMGSAFVRGLQGERPADGVIATAKHFVGYGASEGGMNWAPVHLGPRELREVYLHPFEAVVRTAGLRSLMNAYNELDGVPCGGDRELLTELLREQWGFDGMVVVRLLLGAPARRVPPARRRAPRRRRRWRSSAGLDVELPEHRLLRRAAPRGARERAARPRTCWTRRCAASCGPSSSSACSSGRTSSPSGRGRRATPRQRELARTIARAEPGAPAQRRRAAAGARAGRSR